MDFEQILTQVGEFGSYQQKLFYFVLLPYSFLSAWFHILPLFMISVPDHWCHVPQLDSLPNAMQFKLIRPMEQDASGHFKPSRCQMYDLDYESLFANESIASNADVLIKQIEANQTKRTRPCSNGWTFDRADFDETLVTHSNLYCNRSHLIGNVMSIGGIGGSIGTPLFGALSDKFGRKKTLFWLNIIFLLSTFSPTFCKDFYAYLVSRFMLALVSNAMFQIPFVLTVELVGPKYRARIGTTASVIWGLGMASVPGIAFVLRHWLYFNYVVTLAALVHICLYFLMPESPRWLIAKQRYEEANVILRNIAQQNRTSDKLTENIQFSLVGRKTCSESQAQKPEKGSARVLFTNRKVCPLFYSISLAYVASSMAYNGLHLNTLTVSGNQFLNFFLLTIIEIPACLLAFVLMETRLGRRWTCSFSISFCGVCLLLVAANFSNQFYAIFWSVIGKSSISLAFNVLYQLAVEVYPTPIRNQGLSLSATFSNLQSIILPQLVTIGSNDDSVNFVTITLIGCICVISGIVLTFIPETLNENLPQSIEDAENFARNRSYWSLAKSK